MSTPKLQPRLVRGGLTGAIYVLTRYKDMGDGRLVVSRKYDVTADYEALVAADPRCNCKPPKISKGKS